VNSPKAFAFGEFFTNILKGNRFMNNKVYTRKPLGNTRFKWKQKDFALSTFNCVAEDMDLMIRNCKEAGFNLLELGWGVHDKAWEAVDVCEKHGIDIIFQDLDIFGGMMDLHDNRPVDDEKIVETAKALRDKKHVVGYYIWDEPHREYLFREARRQSDILEKEDPEALLFSVFPPSYNPGPTWENGEYFNAFEKFLQIVSPPVLSTDIYPIGDYCELYPGHIYTDEMQLDNSPMWLDLFVARSLAKKYELPFWFYYQASKVYNTEKLTFPMIRMMMYSGILYGAKGLQSLTATGACYLSEETPPPYPTENTALLVTGEKGEFFEDTKKIHTELKALGNTLMALVSTGVFHSSDLIPYGKYNEIYKKYADDPNSCELITGDLPKRTSVGEFADDYGNRYILVLNREFEKTLKADIPLNGKYNIYEVSKIDGKQKLIREASNIADVDLAIGDAILLRLQPSGEEKFTVEYMLGD